MTNDQPISRIVERLFSECLPPSFKPFIDRAQAEKILVAEWCEQMDELNEENNELTDELSRVRGLLQRLYLALHNEDDPNCPLCGKYRDHESDCEWPAVESSLSSESPAPQHGKRWAPHGSVEICLCCKCSLYSDKSCGFDCACHDPELAQPSGDSTQPHNEPKEK